MVLLHHAEPVILGYDDRKSELLRSWLTDPSAVEFITDQGRGERRVELGLLAGHLRGQRVVQRLRKRGRGITEIPGSPTARAAASQLTAQVRL